MNRTLPLLWLLLAPGLAPAQAHDPLESWNRVMMRFNDAADGTVLKPVAEIYVKGVPSFVRTAVGNFFGNLGDGWSAFNHLLQGKPEGALNMTLRMAVNTTFGLGGLLDIAGEAGLERRAEDFGQTLGVWGLPAGPYLVLPLLGPSSLRDAAGTTVELSARTSPEYTDNQAVANAVLMVGAVHARASLLGASKLLDEIALDRYVFLRDAYLARRRNLVYDGNPPEEGESVPK